MAPCGSLRVGLAVDGEGERGPAAAAWAAAQPAERVVAPAALVRDADKPARLLAALLAHHAGGIKTSTSRRAAVTKALRPPVFAAAAAA